MNKLRLLIKMLLVTALLCMSGSVWAEATVIYGRAMVADVENGYTAWSNSDVATSGTNVWIGNFSYNESYGLYGTGKGNRSSILTYSHTDYSIQTIDIVFDNLINTGNASNYSYIRIGSDIEIRSNQQNQNGAVIINGNSSPISNCNQKNYNRGGDKWDIHAEINTKTLKITTLTIVGTTMNGKSATYTLNGEAALSSSATFNTVTIGTNRAGGEPSAALTSIRIAEEAQVVSTADYTINYKYNGSVIKSENGNKAIGTLVEAENPITVSDTRYFIKAGETTSMTIADGTNTLNVDMRLAEKYSYTVKAIDGSSNVLDASLASGSVVEGDVVNVTYPRWILSGSTLYACGSGSVSYNTSFTPDANNYIKNITYNSGTVNNVVFYTEAEDVAGASVGTNNQRASKNQMGHTGSAETYKQATTLSPGKYKIYMRGQNGNSAKRTFNFKVGDNVVLNGEIANGTNVDANSDEFSVYETSALSFASEGSSASGVDYFYVVKTGDAIATATLDNNGYATFAAPYALDLANLPAGLKAYQATSVDGVNIRFDEVTKAVQANTGLLMEGTADESYNIPVVASGNDISATNLLKVNANGATFSGETNHTYYAMLKNTYPLVFATFDPATLAFPATKAYLDLTGGSEARLNALFGDEEATSIKNLTPALSEGEGAIYTLDGRKANKADLKKGVYVVNGKKVVIK